MKKIIEVSFEIRKKMESFVGKFIMGILIIFFGLIGCSDMPYLASTLPVHEVDRYLVSTDGNAVCFQDDFNSTCIKLIPEIGNGANTTNNTPAIHIYPERRVYVFYYEGNPILRAERTQQTPTGTDASTANGQSGNGNNGNGNNRNTGNNNNGNGNNGGDGNTNNNNGNGNNGGDGNTNNNGNGNNGGDGNTNNNGNDNNGGDGNTNNNGNDNNGGDGNTNNNGNDNNGGNGNNSDDGHGWLIWVYYPDGTSPENPPTLSESGVTVAINGQQLTDQDISGFAQFIDTNNEKGVQFFYPTESAELLDLKVRIEGVVTDGETTKFNINYLWKSQ